MIVAQKAMPAITQRIREGAAAEDGRNRSTDLCTGLSRIVSGQVCARRAVRRRRGDQAGPWCGSWRRYDVCR
jgi:hypothetical protein